MERDSSQSGAAPWGSGWNVGLAGLIAAGLALAWWLRFVQDDAFIAFHYARSLAEGDGLTWFGRRVEGYTSFLWVLWLSLGFRIGAEPVAFAQWSGLAAFATTLLASGRLAARVGGHAAVGLVAVALLLTSYSFLVYATGGLVTMWHAALVLLALERADALRASEGRDVAAAAGLSAAAGFALLTRLDAAVPLAVISAVVARQCLALRSGARVWSALLLPALALVLPWLVWKQAYYGSVLPATFGAKLGEGPYWRDGLLYLARFVQAYALGFALAALGIGLVAARALPPPRSWLCFAVVVLWSLYVVSTGGDFMEFRFFVLLLPPLAVGIACSVRTLAGVSPPRTMGLGAVLCVLLGLASLNHGVYFVATDDFRMDGVRRLGNYYGIYRDGDWGAIGRPLGAQLAGTGTVLAVGPAGAIPYYSRLESVDMLGLNEPEIQRFGTVRPFRPGHNHYAPPEYLRTRGVHLIIDQPTLLDPKEFAAADIEERLRRWVVTRPRPLRDGAFDVVCMPLPERAKCLAMIYLQPLPALEDAMHRHGWHRLRVDPAG